MKIGIIGTGNMGRAIGVRLAHLGHDVFFGARSDERAREAAGLAGPGAKHGVVDDAARHGDLLVWTVRETNVAKVCRPSLLDGKVVMELNNRDYQNELLAGAWFGESIAEGLQRAAPQARVVKALNTVAMETLDTNPEALRRAGAQIFMAGEDPEAKETVGTLLGQLGFDAVDLGIGAVAFRAVEALGDVIRLLIVRQGRGAQANLQLRMLPGPDLGTIGSRAPSGYS
jgi:hypothetical protein